MPTTEHTLSSAVMEACYQKAQHLTNGILTKSIAFNTTLYPIWISDTDCFWYEREKKNGKEYRLMDANNLPIKSGGDTF